MASLTHAAPRVWRAAAVGMERPGTTAQAGMADGAQRLRVSSNGRLAGWRGSAGGASGSGRRRTTWGDGGG